MSAQKIELKNKYEFINLVLEYGFSPFIPEYDDGIDFILHRSHDNLHLNVQLKSRWTVNRKYFGRSIWIAFPDKSSPREWFLVPHDLLVTHGKQKHRLTDSWAKGSFHKKAPIGGWSVEYSAYSIPILFQTLTQDIVVSRVGHAENWDSASLT